MATRRKSISATVRTRRIRTAATVCADVIVAVYSVPSDADMEFQSKDVVERHEQRSRGNISPRSQLDEDVRPTQPGPVTRYRPLDFWPCCVHGRARLLPLDVEALYRVHDQVRRILAALHHVQHLLEVLHGQERDDLAVLAVHAVPLQVRRMIGLSR
jgi:hypothetical protein